MSHTMPDVPLSPETTESQPARATPLQAAEADLAKAFQLLQARRSASCTLKCSR